MDRYPVPAPLAAVLMIGLSLTGCGGGGGDGDGGNVPPSAPGNQAPHAAVAEPHLSAKPGETVELDGSESADADGAIASFQWEQSGGQPGIDVENARTGKASFVAPEVGADTDFTFRLTVTDDDGATDTVIVTVRIHALVPGNLSPIARAGEDRTAVAGNAVTLDGGGSSDDDGQVTVYAWEYLQETGQPDIVLQSSNTVGASFMAPVVEDAIDATFRLTVTDNSGATDSDTVVITLLPDTAGSNRPPVANAGDDKVLDEGKPFTLTGSGTDPDGDELSFRWAVPDGFTTGETNTPVLEVLDTPDVTETVRYTFTLTVTDDNQNAHSDTVNVDLDQVAEPASATFYFPSKISSTTAEMLRLRGRVSPPQSKAIQEILLVNETVGGEISAGADSTFAVDVSLAIGENSWRVAVIDDDGVRHDSLDTVTIRREADVHRSILVTSNHATGDLVFFDNARVCNQSPLSCQFLLRKIVGYDPNERLSWAVSAPGRGQDITTPDATSTFGDRFNMTDEIPLAAATDAGGDKLYVHKKTNHGASEAEILEMNLGTGDFRRVTAGNMLSPLGRGIAVSNDGQRVWVLQYESGNSRFLLEVDVATGGQTVVATAGDGRGGGDGNEVGRSKLVHHYEEGEGDQLYFWSRTGEAIWNVDVDDDYARTLVSDADIDNDPQSEGDNRGNGPSLSNIGAIAVGSSGDLYALSDGARIIGVDAESGDRIEVVGGLDADGMSAARMAGFFDESGSDRLLLSFSAVPGLDYHEYRSVDPVTGDIVNHDLFRPTGTGPGHVYPLGVASDGDGGRVFYSDYNRELDRFVVGQIDLATGSRNLVVAGNDVGTGAFMTAYNAIEFDPSGQTLYITGNYLDNPANVLALNLDDLSRRLLLQNDGSAPIPGSIRGIALDIPSGKLYLSSLGGTSTSDESIMRFDLASQDMTHLSSSDFGIGTGPSLTPEDVALDTTHSRVYATNRYLDEESRLQTQVLAIHMDTGDRSLISEAGVRGEGSDMTVDAILVDPGTGTLLLNDVDGVVSVEPDSGNRTLVIGNEIGLGPAPYYPSAANSVYGPNWADIAFGPPGTLVAPSRVDRGILLIDTETGDRVVISRGTIE